MPLNNEVDQNVEQSIGSTKKVLNSVANTPRKVINGVKTAKKGVKNVKKGYQVLKMLVLSFSSILSSAIVTILIPLMVAGTLLLSIVDGLNMNVKINKFENGEDFDKEIGEACEIAHGETYEFIKGKYETKLNELSETTKNKLVDIYNEKVEEDWIKITGSDLGSSNLNIRASGWNYTGEITRFHDNDKATITINVPVRLATSNYVDDNIQVADVEIDGNDPADVTKKVTESSCKLHGGDVKDNICKNYKYSISSNLVNSIIGYLQANYTVINTYKNEREVFQDTANKVRKLDIKIGNITPEGKVVTEEDCINNGGTVEGKTCKAYKFTPSKKNVSKTGTCTYSAGKWSTNDDSKHQCSTEEWLNKKTAGSSANSEPTDDESYNYSYFKSKENEEIKLTDFNLDDFNKAIETYGNTPMVLPDSTQPDGIKKIDNKLFYFIEKDIDEALKNVDVNVNKETTENKIICTDATGKLLTDDVACIAYKNTPNQDIVTSETKITVDVSTKNNQPVDVAIHTGIDANNPDFMGDEMKIVKENMELIATANGKSTSGDAEYNEAVSSFVETLNFMCPQYQIELSMLTGETYTGFDAVDGAVFSPGVFGNQSYWYDSSGPKGVWDTAQLKRKDVYSAIWGHIGYLREQGLITGSNWWANGHQVGSPQCTDFVHGIFYTTYGYDCGMGNGKDVARNTVAKYPDKFTDGKDESGRLVLKAGSIISKYEGKYGHVGFINAVETDDNGNIVTITISDANFSRLGAPGGVRLMCKYTWQQFMDNWGPNCTYAVPK